MSDTKIELEGPLDLIFPVIREAFSKWAKEQTPAKIQEQVRNILEDRKEEIIAKLLGMENSWGNWRVDHCNGRAGESAIGDYLKEKREVAIKEWLKTVEFPVMDKAINKAVMEEFKSTYEYALKTAVRGRAAALANEAVNNFIAELGDLTAIDKQLKLEELIVKNKNSCKL